MKINLEVSILELQDDILEALCFQENVATVSDEAHDEIRSYSTNYNKIIRAIARAIAQDVSEVEHLGFQDREAQAESIEQDALDALDELNKD